jgi:DnaK suppressor protein
VTWKGQRSIANGLTPEQLEELRGALEQKLAELRQKNQENRTAATVVDDELVETADLANRETTTAEGLGLAEQQRELIEEVEAALERMEAGTYGISEVGGKPIPYRRLLAIPWARNDAHEEELLEHARL